ncbi:18789_t:CDS:2, partial [Dentiscutata erythropus]
MVNNEDLNKEQQLKVKEFLLNEMEMFAQELEDLGQTNAITHSINTVTICAKTGGALPVRCLISLVLAGFATKISTARKLRVEILPKVRNDAVKRIKKAQESAKRRHDQDLQHIKEFKKGDLILVYKASQQHSKSHKLHLKWKGPFVIHRVLEKRVYKLRSVDEK